MATAKKTPRIPMSTLLKKEKAKNTSMGGITAGWILILPVIMMFVLRSLVGINTFPFFFLLLRKTPSTQSLTLFHKRGMVLCCQSGQLFPHFKRRDEHEKVLYIRVCDDGVGFSVLGLGRGRARCG